MLKLLAINILILLGVVLVLIFKLDLYILLIVVAFGGIIDFLYLSRYSSMKNKLILERDDKFVVIIFAHDGKSGNGYKTFYRLKILHKIQGGN